MHDTEGVEHTNWPLESDMQRSSRRGGCKSGGPAGCGVAQSLREVAVTAEALVGERGGGGGGGWPFGRSRRGGGSGSEQARHSAQ